MSKENPHQVYIYYDPRKNNQAFYIGESGTEDRWLFHLEEAKKFIEQNRSQKWIGKNAENPHKTRTIMKIIEAGFEPIIEKVLENVDEKTAKAEEIRLIAHHGRADKGLGSLTNMTDGGDGCSGIIWTKESRQKLSDTISGRKLSEEHIQKISESNKGNYHSINSKLKMREAKLINPSTYWLGKNRSENTKRKISETKQGIPLTKEHKENISDGLKRKWKSEKHGNIDKRWYNNGVENKRYYLNEQPEGWNLGRFKTKNRWYNNGAENKFFIENEQPEGWVRGRLKLSDGTKQKMSIAKLGRKLSDKHKKKISKGMVIKWKKNQS